MKQSLRKKLAELEELLFCHQNDINTSNADKLSNALIELYTTTSSNHSKHHEIFNHILNTLNRYDKVPSAILLAYQIEIQFTTKINTSSYRGLSDRQYSQEEEKRITNKLYDILAKNIYNKKILSNYSTGSINNQDKDDILYLITAIINKEFGKIY